MTPQARYWLAMAALVAALLLAYLAGNDRVPLFDRDEPRYALTSRAMLDSGDFIVPRLMGEVRTAKPPAIYWLQAAAMAIFGTNEFAVRLPAALACTATVALLAAALPPLVGRRRAAWTCFTLGTCVLVLGVAKVGVVDGVLLLCAAAMQIALMRLLRTRGSGLGNALLLWCAIGIGGLLKGPVILGVLLTSLACFWMLNRIGKAGGAVRFPMRSLRPFLGFALIALICGPWLILVSLQEPGFVTTALTHDVATRSVRGLEGHGQPPGFHLLALLGTWFPWSVVLPATLVNAWRRRGSPLLRFALAACVGPWLMFEIVATKLPHYLLVIFPTLALLCADWIVLCLRRLRSTHQRPWGMKIAAIVYAAVALGFATTPFVLASRSIAGTAAAGLMGLLLLWTWWSGRLRAGLLVAGVGTVLIVALAYLDWLGQAPLLTVSQRTADSLRAAGAAEVAMVHYKEPSLAWYALEHGITAREADEAALSAASGFALTTRRRWDTLSNEVRRRWAIVDSIPARLYNRRGEGAEILVLKAKATLVPTATE